MIESSYFDIREANARHVGSNPKLLRARLQEAKSCLRREILPYFKNATFDFVNKRLVGRDGVCLQWKLRPNPDEPESHGNQQTTIGTVSVEVLK